MRRRIRCSNPIYSHVVLNFEWRKRKTIWSFFFGTTSMQHNTKGENSVMSVLRSKNCARYYDTVNVYVDATVSVEGREDTCSVDVSAFSCQTSEFERPDDVTRTDLIERGRTALSKIPGCVTDDSMPLKFVASTNLMGAQEMEYSPEKLVKLGMTSNCYTAGNDPNNATHIGRAVCHPMESMTNALGQRVKNTNMKIHSNLAVCDLSDEAMPQVMEDLRKVAAHNSSQNGFTPDRPEDLACTFSVLPHI